MVQTLLSLDSIAGIMMPSETWNSITTLITRFPSVVSTVVSMWVSTNLIHNSRVQNVIPQFLDSFKYQGQPAALHLIIVAATPPSDDSNEACVSPGEYSPWIFLAKKMAEVKYFWLWETCLLYWSRSVVLSPEEYTLPHCRESSKCYGLADDVIWRDSEFASITSPFCLRAVRPFSGRQHWKSLASDAGKYRGATISPSRSFQGHTPPISKTKPSDPTGLQRFRSVTDEHLNSCTLTSYFFLLRGLDSIVQLICT
jgi:hypothetical protein